MTDQRIYKILYIEDNQANRQLVQLILERKEYLTLFMAADGKSGIETARRDLPDLILLDILLTDLDGMEVCGQLRANPATRNIPVIFLTAHDTTARIEQAMNMGASDILGKPVDTRDLLVRIQAMLETHHIHNEHQRLLEYITRIQVLRSQAEELD